MKKRILVLIALLLMLVGCKQEKFYLDDEHYGKANVVQISNDELKEKEENKNNFGLFVFLPGCSSCAEFSKVLKQFTEDYNIEFYSLSIKEAEGTAAEDVEYAPSFIVYHEGKAVDMLDAASDEDTSYFKNSESFKTWIEEYIYLEK